MQSVQGAPQPQAHKSPACVLLVEDERSISDPFSQALAREGLGALVVCGGVAANRGLRAGLAEAAGIDGFALFIPPPKRCTDNASMIAAAGSDLFVRGKHAGLDLAVDPGLEL